MTIYGHCGHSMYYNHYDHMVITSGKTPNVNCLLIKAPLFSCPAHFRTLLAHPNTVLLINQAGSNSPIEAINNRIPMISMPLNMDQV